ncbi:TPA: glycosyltransferase family 2 protein [Vibrio campbellii]
MSKVSIVITAKNAEKHLKETLESINRSEGINKLEIVFIDDGSTDSTSDIIKSFNFNDSIDLVYEYVELGRARALNYGLSICTNHIVCILDADDLFHKDKLRIQYEVFKKNREVKILATRYSSGSSSKTFLSKNIDKNIALEKLELKDIIKSNPICHSSVMFDKKNMSYSEERKMQIDLEMWLRYLQQNDFIFIIDADLVFKRLHPNQSFESKRRIKYVLSSYFLTLSYAKPYRKHIFEITYRTARLFFHLIPRTISKHLK